MALSVTTEERLAAAVAYLRESGHEEEARAVEGLLEQRSGGSPDAAARSAARQVPIAEAAELLGETPAQVRRRIELGMLAGIRGDQAEYRFVTRESLDDLLVARRLLAIVAEPLPGESKPDAAERSLVAQMLADATELDRAERG